MKPWMLLVTVLVFDGWREIELELALRHGMTLDELERRLEEALTVP